MFNIIKQLLFLFLILTLVVPNSFAEELEVNFEIRHDNAGEHYVFYEDNIQMCDGFNCTIIIDVNETVVNTTVLKLSHDDIDDIVYEINKQLDINKQPLTCANESFIEKLEYSSNNDLTSFMSALMRNTVLPSTQNLTRLTEENYQLKSDISLLEIKVVYSDELRAAYNVSTNSLERENDGLRIISVILLFVSIFIITTESPGGKRATVFVLNAIFRRKK